MTSEAETQHKLEEQFWSEIDSSPFVMLGLHGVDDSFTRPMTAQLCEREIYFFADRSEDLYKGLQRSGRAIATYASKGHDLFASIRGTLVEDNDRAMIDRLWNPMIASWYKDGRDDPNLVLLRFEADQADVWNAQLGSTLKAAALKLIGRDPGKDHQDDNRAAIPLNDEKEV